MPALDHLVYATPNLDATVEDLATRLGTRPASGGSHPGLGTRNALLSVGPSSYLEVIGPDPEQPDPDSARPFGIDDLTGAALVTWAAGVDDMAAALAEARANGYDPGEPVAMRRSRPDGVELSWRLTPPQLTNGGIVPFFIDWGGSAHPATDAPAVRLVDFALLHPRPPDIRYTIFAVGAQVPLRVGGRVGVLAVIEGPAGQVTL
ncbi:MAG: VOC family protein [Mycobacteriales bacterium]